VTLKNAGWHRLAAPRATAASQGLHDKVDKIDSLSAKHIDLPPPALRPEPLHCSTSRMTTVWVVSVYICTTIQRHKI